MVKREKVWHVVVLKPHTGDIAYIHTTYYNRGHAVMKLRGLINHAWRNKSEMQYGIRRG